MFNIEDDESSNCDIKSVKSLEIDDLYEEIPDIPEDEILRSSRSESQTRSGNLKSMQVKFVGGHVGGGAGGLVFKGNVNLAV